MNSMYANNRNESEKTCSSIGMSVVGWLLGGLGLGALVMYFLDPDAGADRREGAVGLAKQAGQRIGKVRDSVMSAVQAESISDAVDQIKDALPSQITENSEDDEEESSSPLLSLAATAVGCALMGAAVMYLMDPDAGARRRGYLRDQATSKAKGAADYVSSKSRHLRNKAQGMYHDASQTIQNSRLGGLTGNDESQ